MFELLGNFRINLFGERTESERMAAFNDRLALAPEHYIAVGAVPYPKLFCAADYCEEMAVPHKNA